VAQKSAANLHFHPQPTSGAGTERQILTKRRASERQQKYRADRLAVRLIHFTSERSQPLDTGGIHRHACRLIPGPTPLSVVRHGANPR
jgi:hypothetical protein